MRNLDPMFVRAIVYTEAPNMDPCSAAKVCSKSCIDKSCTTKCFGRDGSGNSECYSKGYTFMKDPRTDTAKGSEACTFENAAPSDITDAPIDWKWCGLGLMQNIEPPYTFWPDNYVPAGKDNPYKDVFTKSGFGHGTTVADDTYYPQLDAAQSCDKEYNPFNVGDSLCLGTLKLERMVRQGYKWIEDHSEQLGFTDTGKDTEKAKVFAYYIAANMYTGWWHANTRDESKSAFAFPTCASGASNGQCWTSAFYDSRQVTDDYCIQNPDDTIKCQNGHPYDNPPYHCYGYTDFVKFVRNCYDPFDYRPDSGANKTSTYYWFNNGCSNSFCPYGKALLADINKNGLVQPLPLSGNPYVLDQTVKPK
jgi:hypothetical protein